MYLVEEILREGSRLAEEVEVFVAEGRSLSADLKRTKVSRAAESRFFSMSIRTIRKGRIGISSTSSPDGWKRCLDASSDSARLATPQPWGGLPLPVSIGNRELSYDPLLTPDEGSLARLLDGMIQGAASHPVEITSGGAGISVQTLTLANSNGVQYSRHQSHVSASIETIKGTSTGHEFGSSWTLDLDPFAIGERAGFLAAESEHGEEIESGVYDVVLSPVAFAQLVGTVLVPALSGRNVHAGRSRLGGSMGQRVIDSRLSLSDDPFLEKGLSSTPWDAEGVPTRRIPFITRGVLENFSYDLKTAYRFSKESTGSAVRGGHGGSPSIGVHNVVLDGPRADLMAESAVYVEDVVGAHTANPLSGDFSVELTNPFFVRGGTYERPVRKAMMSGNVFEMLGEIAGLGRDDRVIGSLVLPSIRLNNQHIIGNSHEY